MTKLHSPRGWLGYFVGCESEAMYHIYSPKKHKVYRIRVARIKDGEGLDDPHDTPCLEDRVPTTDPSVPDQPISETDDGMTSDENSDNESVSFNIEEAGPSIELETQTLRDDIHQLQPNIEDIDTNNESESKDDIARPGIISRYFAQSRHAAIVKRKRTDEIIPVPRKSR